MRDPGKFFDGNGAGPNQTVTDEYIGKCNEGATGDTYSLGWVNTAGAITPGARSKCRSAEVTP